nr:hypothetical protein [Tanacetum cinerariifolium]
LKPFITAIENQINKKVKVIGCDNETGFKNRDLEEFCRMKGNKREYSNARTSQQNGVAERKNRTLVEAARTMLADSLLFWAEAVNTAYPLGKFKGKADEGFLVGYSVTSKAFRVFNTKTRKVEENMHVRFFKNKNVAGIRPTWLFDIDSLTNLMNYIPVSTGNQTDKNAGLQDTNSNADDKAEGDKPKDDTGSKTAVEPINKEDQAYRDELDRLMSQEKEASDVADSLSKDFEQGCMDQKGAAKAGSTNSFNSVSNPVNAASTSGTFSTDEPSSPLPDAFIPDDTLLHVDQDDS